MTLVIHSHSQRQRCTVLPLKVHTSLTILRLLSATVHTSLRHRKSLEIQISTQNRGRIYWETIAFYAKRRRDNQLQPREDKQLQSFKAKTAPTVAIHILQFLVQHLKVPAEIKLQSQTFHNDEWCSYCDDRVVECSCRECPA